MFDTTKLEWINEPKESFITPDRIEIVTEPQTDLWQKTYYHFQADNAPILQMKTSEAFFSFTFKTEFKPEVMYDQCGVIVYLNSDNWIKGSIEYETSEFQHLGSVVTNHGYSDWATQEVGGDVQSIWYRLSRRQDDFKIECSFDGQKFEQMRIAHLHEGKGEIQFGLYACSPGNSSFRAIFTDFELGECQWLLRGEEKAGDALK